MRSIALAGRSVRVNAARAVVDRAFNTRLFVYGKNKRPRPRMDNKKMLHRVPKPECASLRKRR